MIEVNDIMIGNYISLKEIKIDEYLTHEPRVIRVDSIYFDVLFPEIYLINGYVLRFYDPIIITEDWLISLNFNYCQKFDEWFETPDQTGIVISRNYENGHWYFNSISIQYVHELQNLFRMENKINLLID